MSSHSSLFKMVGLHYTPVLASPECKHGTSLVTQLQIGGIQHFGDELGLADNFDRLGQGVQRAGVVPTGRAMDISTASAASRKRAESLRVRKDSGLKVGRGPALRRRPAKVRGQLQDMETGYLGKVAIVREKRSTAGRQRGHKLKRVWGLDSRCRSQLRRST
jgi:hypothetical protein